MRGRTLQIAIKVGSTYLTIAQATSHKLTVSAQTADVTTKDEGKTKEVTGRSWSLSTDNLICDFPHTTTVGVHGLDLMTRLTAGTEVDIRLQYVDASLPQDDENEADESNVVSILTGKARITKMDLNFQNKENASYTAEFQGIGKPTIPA